MSVGALPAAPLANMVERLVAHAEPDDPQSVRRHETYRALTIHPRAVYVWRTQPRATVSWAVADRVLSASPYLWFDVWPECDQHHERPDRDCSTCRAYYRARFLFTGARLPRGFGRSR